MKRASTRMRDRARALRQQATLSETRVWGWLRNRTRDGVKFRRQFPAGRYVLDFYCPELKLAIEIDGRQHADRRVAEQDDVRTAVLMREGIRVVRVENRLIAMDPLMAGAQIDAAIEERRRAFGK